MILIKLLAAIIMIESGGNDLAYNKREDACGCLQIRPIMVAEFNRIGIPFTLDDRWNCGKSRKWNGGPNGHKKASTLKYWKKVKQQLQTNKPR